MSYRLPTEAELDAERQSWSFSNAAGAIASPLKLPLAGSRSLSNSLHGTVGFQGLYWSSTISGISSRALTLSSSLASIGSPFRAYGNSVRCIKTSTDSIPTVTTDIITSINATSAVSGGNVIHDGGAPITARGVCWSTSPNPILANSISSIGAGTGTGLFGLNIIGLNPSSTYYVRAYATNCAGTAYGNQVVFNTTACNPGAYPSGYVHCSTPTPIGDVTNPITGNTWMDRNLGASQVATQPWDTNSYGDLYQWGRFADSHQCRTSNTTTTVSTTDQPGHGYFILASSSPYDWRNPQNTNLWQGVNGVNNPCPVGYRLPTDAELNAERMSWTPYFSAVGAFASPLKLPVAGCRSNSDGLLYWGGSQGFYWSSTVSGSNSIVLNFMLSCSIGTFSKQRAGAYSVRCIKEGEVEDLSKEN
jgi:hypothetical protein